WYIWQHPPPMPFFFSTWLFQPLFLPSILSDVYRWGRAGQAIGSLRKLFGKDGLWTQPTLFGRGELPRMVTTHGEAAVSECGTCVAYFKRRWTNVTNVKKFNFDRPRSEAAHRELSRFSRLPTPGLPATVKQPAPFVEGILEKQQHQPEQKGRPTKTCLACGQPKSRYESNERAII